MRQDRAQQLYKELIYDGINVDVIHADRAQTERDNVVKAFREGKVWVLICTELIGRGIDFKGVNLVVNYDFPPSAIAYIHRIGRTGRAGRRGRAITYFTQSDTLHLKSIARVMRNSGCDVPKFMLTMKDHSKRALNKLRKAAKPREDIRTGVKFGKNRTKPKNKLNVGGAGASTINKKLKGKISSGKTATKKKTKSKNLQKKKQIVDE